MARRKANQELTPIYWKSVSGWCLSRQYDKCPGVFPGGECTHDYHENPDKYQPAGDETRQAGKVRKVRTPRAQAQKDN